MKLPPLQEGTFIRRLNRFAALVEVEGCETLVHVANSGRMRELFQPGNPCGLAHVPKPGRKTAYDLALVTISPGQTIPRKGKGQGHVLVSADARLPNRLVWEAFSEGRLAPFRGYTQARREVAVPDGRLDLLLEGPAGSCFLETKSVTLVEEGVALFPDAPTERGRRHMGSLAQAVALGHRAAVLFIIQREDAWACAPNDRADPAFGMALREAVASGVEAYAYTCSVTPAKVRISRQVPVQL